MKKNVLLVIPFLGYTGAERVIFTLLNNLDRANVNPHLLIYSDKDEKNALLKHLKGDVSISAINFKGRFRYNVHNIIFGIHKACKRYSIDTVLISDGSTNASIAPFLKLIGNKNTRFIARESNLPSLFEKNQIVKILYRIFYKNYNTIIAQSDDMFTDLTKKIGIPESKIVKINNPIDLTFINERIIETPEFTLEKDKINLLTIGRLTYQKGYDLLLNAFSKLNNIENYHLTIIGSGEEEHNLKRQCTDLNLIDFVTFYNQVDNPYAIMKQADVYISSSRWEGYPNVVIEAIACGIPVLANKYPGGINEIIKPENGVICDVSTELEPSLEHILTLQNIALSESYNNVIFKKYMELL
ncbi:glycosyltransferase [Klebsiella pneumoniae]|uniref:glycosyltransferase n=3 Tax=Klebsiella pneumoniae complex TaxID=3390273 RepID=UPI00133052F1|nr:glycosyltransferase [Klebsiella pneumoniae]